MTSEDAGPVPAQRLDHGLNSSLLFHDQSHRFNCCAWQCGPGDPELKTRDLGAFIGGRYFKPQVEEFRPSVYAKAGRDRRDHENWNENGRSSSGDGSEGDDDDDDEDEYDDVDGEVEGLGGAAKIGNGEAKYFSSFVGSSREAMMMDGRIVQSGNENNNARASPSEDRPHGRLSQYQNAVSVADVEGSLYFSRYLQGPGGSSSTGQKDTVYENGSGFRGRKDSSFSNERGASLRAILSDPLTGKLMDDAVILPCGHSFGAGGMQHVIRMKACYTCSQAVSEDSVAPNLSLQAAIQAFRREEELHVYRASKRRRERFEQEKGTYGDSTIEDHPRSRGVQFPFAVTDRVIIKGNKRTPPRFVGREAVVTTQCLNGWYVVKTLDNAESVKLQYRSLAKISDDSPTKPTSDKMTPNGLKGCGSKIML